MFLNAKGPVDASSTYSLYYFLTTILSGFGGRQSYFWPIVTYLILYLQAVLLNNVLNQFRVMPKPGFLIAASYLLITSFFPDTNIFSPALLINFILIFVLAGLMALYNKSNGNSILFNIGLAIGLSTLFYLPSILFYIWVVLAVAILRPFRIKDYFVFLLGVLVPLYFYASYVVWFDLWDAFSVLHAFQFGWPKLQMIEWQMVAIILTVLPAAAGGYFLQLNQSKMLIHVRKIWATLFVLFLLSFAFLFFDTKQNLSNYLFVSLAASIFLAAALYYSRTKVFLHLLFWLLIVYIIFFQYGTLGW